MKRLYTMLALAALAIGLSACAGEQKTPLTLTQKLEAKSYVMVEPVARISSHRINGLTTLDNYHAIMSAGVNERYLVTLRNSCMNLSSSVHIGYTTSTGSLTPMDKLLVRDVGGYVQHCFISEIMKLAKLGKPSTDN